MPYSSWPVRGGYLTGPVIQSVLQGGNCAAVTAVANANYHFANWTGDVASAANSLTVTNT